MAKKGEYTGPIYYLTPRGQRLDDLLYERNMSASALANAIHVDRKRIYDYMHEATDPKLSLVIKMADYFGVSIDRLVN